MIVSVIIPVFNGAATVAAAIDSALAQKFDGDFEVVVINDGSTDATAEVLSSYRNRIKVVTQENRGLAAARNAGVRNSTGEYLAFLDADDFWFSEKLTKTISAFDGDEAEAGLVYTDATLVDGEGRVVAATYIPPTNAHEPSLSELLREWWYILPSAAVMRRSIFDRCGGFSEEFGQVGRGGEDLYMWLRAREIAPFRLIRSPLVRYRVATASERQSKREAALEGMGTAPNNSAKAWRYIHGELIFERLIRQRYGARAKRMIKNDRTSQASLLEGFGLEAMSRGEIASARGCYLVSIRRNPLRLRIWIRLAWALMPRSVRLAVVDLLPDHLARAVEGPPYDPMKERESSTA